MRLLNDSVEHEDKYSVAIRDRGIRTECQQKIKSSIASIARNCFQSLITFFFIFSILSFIFCCCLLLLIWKLFFFIFFCIRNNGYGIMRICSSAGCNLYCCTYFCMLSMRLKSIPWNDRTSINKHLWLYAHGKFLIWSFFFLYPLLSVVSLINKKHLKIKVYK